MSETAVGSATTAFPGKYLSITSFRRDGTGKATPVWFVQEGGRLLVETDAGSYKVTRIRRNPWVTIAPCTATGRLRGQPVTARAELLPDAEIGRVERLVAGKYRVDLVFIRPIRSLQAALHLAGCARSRLSWRLRPRERRRAPSANRRPSRHDAGMSPPSTLHARERLRDAGSGAIGVGLVGCGLPGSGPARAVDRR